MSEFEAKARAIQLSYPSPPEKWFAENPGSAAEFVAIMEKAQEQNYAAIAAALEDAVKEAVEGELETCIRGLSNLADDYRRRAQDRVLDGIPSTSVEYSVLKLAASMLRTRQAELAPIRSRT
jgi:hypothetical protein